MQVISIRRVAERNRVIKQTNLKIYGFLTPLRFARNDTTQLNLTK